MNVESHYGNLEVALPAKNFFPDSSGEHEVFKLRRERFQYHPRKHFDDEDRDKNYTYED